MNKRGQMDLSFGMIWAIIIVIVFISFTIYVTLTFLDFSSKTKITQFETSIQSSIDDIWKSPQGSNTVSYSLPTSIEMICFFDETSSARGKNSGIHNTLLGLVVDENLMFYPEASGEGENGLKLEHINIKNITKEENPYCIENVKGKVTVNLRMNYGENSVLITR